jgi:hypothetical protein
VLRVAGGCWYCSICAAGTAGAEAIYGCYLKRVHSWRRELGAHSQQISVDSFGFGDEEGDTKPVVIVDEKHFVKIR